MPVRPPLPLAADPTPLACHALLAPKAGDQHQAVEPAHVAGRSDTGQEDQVWARTIDGRSGHELRRSWRRGGRRRKLSDEDLAMARALLKDPSIPVAQVAKRLGVSRATFYAYFPGARTRSMSGAGA